MLTKFDANVSSKCWDIFHGHPYLAIDWNCSCCNHQEKQYLTKIYKATIKYKSKSTRLSGINCHGSSQYSSS